MDKPQWKEIVHVWDSMTELTYPPHRTIAVKFIDGTEGRYSYNTTIAELKRQGKMGLLSTSHLSPKELDAEIAFFKYIKETSLRKT